MCSMVAVSALQIMSDFFVISGQVRTRYLHCKKEFSYRFRFMD